MSERETPAPRPTIGRRALTVLAWCVFAPLVLLHTLWATLALYFSNLPWPAARLLAASAFAAGTLLLFARIRRRGRALFGFAVAFALVITWWWFIPASNDGDWGDDVAIPPTATLRGDHVTVHGVRDFRYRSNTEYRVQREDRTYDLRELDSAWFLVSYWGTSTSVAHTMLSFGFGPDDFLAVSVEARKEIGETYSPYSGAFKQFELAYVLGDERDVIGVRTHHRDESVYLYPLEVSAVRRRALLEDILRGANRVAHEPQHYLTIGQNCTTTLVGHLNAVFPQPVPLRVSLFLNG